MIESRCDNTYGVDPDTEPLPAADSVLAFRAAGIIDILVCSRERQPKSLLPLVLEVEGRDIVIAVARGVGVGCITAKGTGLSIACILINLYSRSGGIIVGDREVDLLGCFRGNPSTIGHLARFLIIFGIFVPGGETQTLFNHSCKVAVGGSVGHARSGNRREDEMP